MKASFCPTCEKKLRWFDLVPMLSYINLRGMCRNCGSPISIRYFIVESMCGIVTFTLLLFYGISPQFFDLLFFFVILLIIGLIDWQYLIIPNNILLAGFLAGILIKIIYSSDQIPYAVLSAIIGLLSFLGLQYFGRRIYRKPVLGSGDVKLAGLLGFYLGMGGFFFALWLAAIFGVVYGIFKHAQNTLTSFQLDNDIRDSRYYPENKIPFGAFLVLSSFIVGFISDEYFTWIIN